MYALMQANMHACIHACMHVCTKACNRIGNARISICVDTTKTRTLLNLLEGSVYFYIHGDPSPPRNTVRTIGAKRREIVCKTILRDPFKILKDPLSHPNVIIEKPPSSRRIVAKYKLSWKYLDR